MKKLELVLPPDHQPEKRPSKLTQATFEALAGEKDSAKAAGTLGYMGRILVQCTMPHSKQKGAVYQRKNGAFTLKMMNDPDIGLPYGRYPRLLMAWVTTRVNRDKGKGLDNPRELELGHSVSSFMQELGLQVTGGKTGTIRNLREQMIRLFSSTISYHYSGKAGNGKYHGFEEAGFRVADSHRLWWTPSDPDQSILWGSSVVLSQNFYDALTERPVPVDLRALKELRSSLALDLYIWLGWRMFTLNESGKAKAEIPWELLHLQLGSQYAQVRDFKIRALKAFKQVQKFYPEARISDEGPKLLLKPSPLAIARK